MAFHRFFISIVLALATAVAVHGEEPLAKWDRDVGKVAPRLTASGWLGTPVMLEAVKGNTVVLAFWNMDVPWC